MNIFKKIISYIWELPQDVLGFIISRNCKFRHEVNGRMFYEWKSYEGMSLGHFIFMHPRYIGSKLIRHEYGHCIQSSILGWLYLPIVGISSWVWYHRFAKYRKKHPRASYYDMPIESWANRLGKVRMYK